MCVYILNYNTVPALSILWDRAQKDCTEGLRPVPRYSSNPIGGLVSMQLIGQTLDLEKPNVICGMEPLAGQMHVRCLEASHHRTSSEYHTNLYLCLNVILDSVLYAITDGDLSNIHTVDEAVEKMGFGTFCPFLLEPSG